MEIRLDRRETHPEQEEEDGKSRSSAEERTWTGSSPVA